MRSNKVETSKLSQLIYALHQKNITAGTKDGPNESGTSETMKTTNEKAGGTENGDGNDEETLQEDADKGTEKSQENRTAGEGEETISVVV